MLRLYLVQDKIYITDKTEKEFRVDHKMYEQISILKNADNVDIILDKIIKQYKPKDVIRDYTVKMKFGWKYWSPEIQEKIRVKISESLSKYKKTDEHKRKLSLAARKYRHFAGKRHTPETKAKIAFKRMGRNPIGTRRWMHNPITGEEKRGYVLLPQMLWGRSPENVNFFRR